MSYYKFQKGDLLYNRIKTRPENKFVIYNGNIFYNNIPRESGSFTSSVGCTPSGYLSLYEMNVDRSLGSTGIIKPFIEKNSSLTSFKTTLTGTFNLDFYDGQQYGDTLSGSYPLSASISSDYYAASSSRGPISGALKNVFNYYKMWSPNFAYSSSLGDKGTQELRLVSIPSIFYGSSINKGSVSLKFYITGTLASELRDDKKNGELRVYSGNNSGSVAGLVLYNEGFVLLTGTGTIDSSHSEDYTGGGAANPRWIDFATTGSGITGSTFDFSFEGVNYVSTLTMFARADRGDINFSNNPTSLQYNTVENGSSTSGSIVYAQAKDRQIKNVVSASYSNPEPPFEKTVFIENVGIYDEKKNLIAVAKMATPIRKRSSDDLTFKLKLDF